MTEILHTLRAEHADLAKVLDVLEQEAASCRQGGQVNRGVVGDVLDYCRGYAALCHHPKEDLIHGRLRRAADPAAIGVIGDLPGEHEALSALADELEAALDNLASEARMDRVRFVRIAQTFVDRHRRHMKAEDDELFPLAERYLSDEDWAEIDRGVVALEASRPAGDIDERLAALSRLIVAHEELQQRLAGRNEW